jgi:hypothetical protein
MKRRFFFHRLFPRLDRLFHPFETNWERDMRHLQLENPTEYKTVMFRHQKQMNKWRQSARRTGSVGIA